LYLDEEGRLPQGKGSCVRRRLKGSVAARFRLRFTCRK